MLHSGPAGQLEFEFNRLAISIIHKHIHLYFGRQANNQITARIKHQALQQKNKSHGCLLSLNAWKLNHLPILTTKKS